MESRHDPLGKESSQDSGRKIIMHPLYLPKSSPWLDMKVFYVRVSNFGVDESTPEHLTVNHIPLTPDTILEVNGRRSSIYSECVSSLLRRDRVDKKSEEATFVSTDNIKMTGSVRFEVFDRNNLLLAGVLELCNGSVLKGESKNHSKKWGMRCQSVMSAGNGFLESKQYMSQEIPSPVLEVYVAGCSSGNPIILTKTLQLGCRKKQQTKLVLNSIPEYETAEVRKEMPSEDALQVSKFKDFKPENDVDVDYNSIYSSEDYMEGEDGDLSWFNAGVRVGVGMSLGICLGIGVGVGLLVRTYQATTRNFRRRFI